MYVYIHTHMYIYIYMCVCTHTHTLYIYIWVWLCEYMWIDRYLPYESVLVAWRRGGGWIELIGGVLTLRHCRR